MFALLKWMLESMIGVVSANFCGQAEVSEPASHLLPAVPREGPGDWQISVQRLVWVPWLGWLVWLVLSLEARCVLSQCVHTFDSSDTSSHCVEEEVD
jgi:hypothetical protein